MYVHSKYLYNALQCFIGTLSGRGFACASMVLLCDGSNIVKPPLTQLALSLASAK